MPLERISSSEAIARVARISVARWPDGRSLTSRMDTPVDAACKPSFVFSPDDPVMTIGSCFARNIESKLLALNFDVPATKLEIPREERISEVANDILNKYSVHSMVYEIQWAFEPPPVSYTDLFIQVSDELWHDPHLAPNLKPAPFGRVLERRNLAKAIFAELPRCKVVIATLGLAESWFDAKTSLHLNGAPPSKSLQREPDRFFLDVLSYEEILEGLERLREVVMKYGRRDVRLLVTVSPVPFKASFGGDDALVANCYSKSVQRAACEAFVRRHDNVDYFPSYEIVTLSGPAAFMPDNIHVRPEVVEKIMERVVANYGSERRPDPDKDLPRVIARLGRDKVIGIAANLYAERNYRAAIAALKFVEHNFIDKLTNEQKAWLYTTWGSALLRAGDVSGVDILRKALPYDVDNARLNYKLGLGTARQMHRTEAVGWFRRAVRLDGANADYHWRYGVELCRIGERGPAIEALENALRLKPDHEKAKAALEKIQLVQAPSAA